MFYLKKLKSVEAWSLVVFLLSAHFVVLSAVMSTSSKVILCTICLLFFRYFGLLFCLQLTEDQKKSFFALAFVLFLFSYFSKSCDSIGQCVESDLDRYKRRLSRRLPMFERALTRAIVRCPSVPVLVSNHGHGAWDPADSPTEPELRDFARDVVGDNNQHYDYAMQSQDLDLVKFVYVFLKKSTFSLNQYRSCYHNQSPQEAQPLWGRMINQAARHRNQANANANGYTGLQFPDTYHDDLPSDYNSDADSG